MDLVTMKIEQKQRERLQMLKDQKPLQFKLPAEFKLEFKMFATERNMTMTKLFKEMFEFYKRNVNDEQFFIDKGK